jgi:hypothetical protein
MIDDNTQRHYFDAVRAIEQDIREEAARRSGPVQDIGDAIHEAVDGSEWVIYTYRAKAVLDYSDNRDAFRDMGMDSSDWGSDGIPWSQLAYWAMFEDVNSRLDDLVPHG